MKKHILLLSLLLSFGGCKVQFLPDYDASIAQQIDSTNKMIDKFYLNMMEDKAENRKYSNYSAMYVNIEVELISLLNKNKARSLNKDSEKIAENSLKEWEKYKGKHKSDDKISDADIKLNLIYMDEHLLNMRLGEKYKSLNN